MFDPSSAGSNAIEFELAISGRGVAIIAQGDGNGSGDAYCFRTVKNGVFLSFLSSLVVEVEPAITDVDSYSNKSQNLLLSTKYD